MKTRKKVAVIFGSPGDIHNIQMFECLQEHYDTSAFLINTEDSHYFNSTSLKLHLFEDLKDMPGYFRGLEEQLEDFDIILATEASRLSTFQAVRIAAKMHKPIAVLVNEFQPYFYAKYPNIRAIQTDIYQHADMFMATSKLAENNLKMEEVKQDKIRSLLPMIRTKKFFRSEEKRRKFRGYIGVRSDQYLILFNENLENYCKPDGLLNALRLIKTTKPLLFPKIKVLYVGNGSLAEPLKYQAVDFKIGQSVLFLHQNPAAFVSDIYNAADFVVCPKFALSEQHEQFPYHILEAVACGVYPLFSDGGVVAEFMANQVQAVENDSYQHLALEIQNLIQNDGLAEQRAVLAEYVCDHFDETLNRQLLLEHISELVRSGEKKHRIESNLKDEMEIVAKQITSGKVMDALVNVEGLLLREIKQNKIKAELMRLKGDALMHEGRYSEATSAYGDSIHLDSDNHKSYRGLGFIAFHGHSHEEAITFFKKALSKQKDDFESLLGVGLIHKRLGLTQEALIWLEKCVEIKQNDSRATTALMQACLECRESKIAIGTLERVIDTVGETPALVMALGQLYIKDGDTKKGKELLRKVQS